MRHLIPIKFEDLPSQGESLRMKKGQTFQQLTWHASGYNITGERFVELQAGRHR